MEQHSTTQLRSAASTWSLDGDKKLLELLKSIHEKVVHKCKETNSMFEQMVTTLDEANIDVQSVNNRFMSLSNSQFVESRVYGDDTDLNTDVPTANASSQPTTLHSEIFLMKTSLQQLENHHDVLEIFPDTDSDSDDEGITSVVLKPKNVYADRPLPYIIGTSNWRNKWHSGTIPSESESSSTRSRSQMSQYSESGSEPGNQPANWPAHDDTLSSRSLSPSPPAPPAPAQIASELAKRLSNIAQPPEALPVYEQPKMDTTKINKPEARVTATIFSDEPPPLPQISDAESEFEDENDIFAELHKTNKRKSVDSGLHNVKPNNPPVNKKSTVVQEDSEPDLFTPKPQPDSHQQTTENIVKKPIGGISLFGSNKGTESIGAAILQRHQRKSSSDEDSVSDDKLINKPKPNTNNSEAKKQENNIFENLFTKPKVNNKNEPKKAKEIVKNEVNKVDLFKDDIFDDIDDIFSSNIVSKPKNEIKKQKSIFDDDDQLFSEVAITKKVMVETPSQSSIASKNKGLFDSDDELFSDKVVGGTKTNEDIPESASSHVKSIEVKDVLKKTSNIFDDSSDDGMFSAVEIKKPPTVSDTNKTSIDLDKESPKIDTKAFVSQSNDTNIEIKSSNDLGIKKHEGKPNVENIRSETKHVPFHSPSIFDDDDDELFSNSNKINTTNVENSDQYYNNKAALETEIHKSINEVETLVQKPESIKNDGLFTNNKNEANDQPTTSTSTYEIDIDKYYSNTHAEEENDLNEDIGKDDSINHSIEIVKKDTIDEAPTDSDVTDLEAIVEQEKKKLDLEKSLEESLFRRNDTSNQEVLFAVEPPAFEKPKEPKKSQNVNALFDDDSDDETLFFKKEDPITTDEKPEIFETISKPNLFGIFQDEPPDLDFTQKEEKITKTDVQHVENVSNIVPTESQNVDTLDEAKADTKKISKLKMNLNINVNTLLPGASPKKTSKPIIENTNKESNIPVPTSNISEIDVKTETNVNDITETEQRTETDGQTTSAESLPKSVSFDKNPESNVLDNQLSKQRAKIQVKRRPSTRRARHEAVRKSIVNQDESNDSTDNSSSIDDQRSKSEITDPNTNKNNEKTIDSDHNTKEIDQIEIDHVTMKSEGKIPSNKSESVKDNVLPQIHTQDENKTVVSETKQKGVKNIVYILNDEDIFNTNDSNLTESSGKKTNEHFIKENEQKSKILTIIDDDDDSLFKENKEIDRKVTEKSKKTAKPTLFDDSSDDEALFKTKTQIKKPVTIFGSDDSDDDLFFGKKKGTKTSVPEIKKETVVKKSLFSDDEDDDLFGVNTKTAPKPYQATASTSTARSCNPPTVDDPLSNLEEDYTV